MLVNLVDPLPPVVGSSTHRLSRRKIVSLRLGLTMAKSSTLRCHIAKMSRNRSQAEHQVVERHLSLLSMSWTEVVGMQCVLVRLREVIQRHWAAWFACCSSVLVAVGKNIIVNNLVVLLLCVFTHSYLHHICKLKIQQMAWGSLSY